MEQIWIRFQKMPGKEFITVKFWYADEAKNFIDYLRKNPKDFLIVACGGFEDEDELQYVIG